MTHQELYKLLKTTNLPVAYSQFSKATEPPFIVFVRTGNKNILADDKAYVKFQNYDIELYTNKKDLEKEKLIENLFDSNEIIYDVEETYIESEKMYEVIYSIQI